MFRDFKGSIWPIAFDLRFLTSTWMSEKCLSVKLDTFVLIHMAAVSEFKNLHHVIIMSRDLAKSDYR